MYHGTRAAHYAIGSDETASGIWYVVFKAPGQEQWVEMGTCFDRTEALVAVDELRKFTREIHLSSESMHLVEHILLRPPLEEEKFGFAVCDESGKVLLQSRECYSYDFRRALLENLPAALSNLENYSLDFRAGKFYLSVGFEQGGRRIWLDHPVAYHHSEAAENRQRALLTFISNAGQQLHQSTDALVQYGDEMLREQFFSFRLSAVLPGWTPRFSDLPFRSVLGETLAFNAPAHVAPHCIWLSFEQMRKFEKCYFLFFEEKRKTNPNLRRLYLLRDSLLHFLKLHTPADYWQVKIYESGQAPGLQAKI